MPVTLTTAKHPPRGWEPRRVANIEDLFKQSCPKGHAESKKLIGNSFTKDLFETSHISVSENGFVWAVFHAYSHHHNLLLRPEDVWFTILSQLSFFVVAHSEELRHLFVSHKGTEHLNILSDETVGTVDFGELAMTMTELMEKHVVNPDLRSWIMPAFSTTTASDKAVAAIIMMGSMQKYFTYQFNLRCGIPSVTLLGEREDWELMVTKLAQLAHLGDEPARFAQLLRPVLNNFVASFDNPESPDVLSFWGKFADRRGGGSGPTYLTGWISVFCFWDVDGKLLHPEQILPASSPGFKTRDMELELDQGLSRHIDTEKVPLGYVSVPVTVIDELGREFEAVMLAGLIGIQATSSGAMLDGSGGHSYERSLPYFVDDHRQMKRCKPAILTGQTGFDSIQPVSGWLVYEKKPRYAPKDKPAQKPPRVLDWSLVRQGK
ncbi:hypothetical protein N7517_005308 [Penicillium concentricum]|uniref:Uncharacterized protein n=1 Tax=Penicillium concentricum TaxID=293559 RepID=A0A9W9V928_9EURO|nr:uncharacterized protein N7517_005308 [Penicillium concentricum]KAJ5373302.1 hypothetical protein N7517_005308 [Penicillium concentricum]